MRKIDFIEKAIMWLPLLLPLTLTTIACSSDEGSPALVDPQGMFDPSLADYYQEVTVNGTDTYNCSIEFSKNPNDTTKTDMKILGLSPNDMEWKATVTTIRTDKNVIFAGTDSTPHYRFHVEGTWTPASGNGGRAEVKAACRIERRGNDPYLGRTLTYRFKDGWAVADLCGMSEVEFEGKTYSARTAVDSAMTYMAREMAKTYEAMELRFNADGTLAIALRRPGAAEAEPWMDVKYWMNGSTMITLELNNSQAEKFDNDLFGEIDAAWWEPMFATNNGRNTLEIMGMLQTDRLTLAFYGHDFSTAMRLYAKGNGSRLADDRGNKWVQIAAKAMNDDWMVLCPSERIEDTE